MTVPQIPPSAEAKRRELEERFRGAEIVIKPVFAGFPSESGDVPFAFFAVNVSYPPKGIRTFFMRDQIADSMRLAELELTAERHDAETYVFDRELLTSMLPSALTSAGWRCSEARAVAGEPRALYTVALAGPANGNVVVRERDEDILNVLEDAAWCAQHGQPGFQFN